MRRIALALALIGTPAFAHHEVVVATSMMPVMAGIMAIATAAFVAWRGKK